MELKQTERFFQNIIDFSFVLSYFRFKPPSIEVQSRDFFRLTRRLIANSV